MKIGISTEVTRKLRDTWHAAINLEWYDWLSGHEILPLVCHQPCSMRGLDFVIMCGGNDCPGMSTWRDNWYEKRDIFEIDVINQCLQYNIPVVGICRGFHFMNLVMDGTLKYLEQPLDNVKVSLGDMEVTCHHTISIDKLAPGFQAIKSTDNGVIELAINPLRRMLGVGWHPERAINAHTRKYIWEMIQSL